MASPCVTVRTANATPVRTPRSQVRRRSTHATAARAQNTKGELKWLTTNPLLNTESTPMPPVLRFTVNARMAAIPAARRPSPAAPASNATDRGSRQKEMTITSLKASSVDRTPSDRALTKATATVKTGPLNRNC